MTTIVLNTLTAAVSEHNLPFTGISPGYACSGAGLFTIGGDSDASAAIDARVMLPSTQLDAMMKKGLGAVYLGLEGDEGTAGELLVQTPAGDEFAYPVAVRAIGVSRGVPGKGIQEEYLALGYRNLDGTDFQLSYFEPDAQASKTRRL